MIKAALSGSASADRSTRISADMDGQQKWLGHLAIAARFGYSFAPQVRQVLERRLNSRGSRQGSLATDCHDCQSAAQ